MPGSDTVAKLNNYRTLKLAQTATCFALFGIGLFFIYGDIIDDDFIIQVHIFTWTLLVCTILTAIAAVLLHIGNNNADKGSLKAFLVLGCLTYSLFDKCAGGFPVVRRRIEEIEQGSFMI
ncbi:unnamed protein product [Meganyctiphanes norvegica]|uniref:Uncharacterized protein n=1 Tax=Meganyctiphanes norvegica TaxID=48144 RepID=A0AAV2RWY4_MEGNR